MREKGMREKGMREKGMREKGKGKHEGIRKRESGRWIDAGVMSWIDAPFPLNICHTCVAT
jgi:hypothetical protein